MRLERIREKGMRTSQFQVYLGTGNEAECIADRDGVLAGMAVRCGTSPRDYEDVGARRAWARMPTTQPAEKPALRRGIADSTRCFRLQKLEPGVYLNNKQDSAAGQKRPRSEQVRRG